MNSIETPRYIGPNQIFGVTIEDIKTPQGKDVVKVIYVESDKLPAELMPMSTFEILVSTEPHDYNWLREMRYKKLLEDLTALCLENDVRYSDIKYLGTELAKKLDSAFERATNFLWTKDDKQWIPGFNALSDRSLLEAEAILKTIKPNDKSTESEKTGVSDTEGDK